MLIHALNQDGILKVVKVMSSDFVPDGTVMSFDKIHKEGIAFRKLSRDEVWRCCRMTSEDIQSGPIYCGKMAQLLGALPDSTFIALCDAHANNSVMSDHIRTCTKSKGQVDIRIIF